MSQNEDPTTEKLPKRTAKVGSRKNNGTKTDDTKIAYTAPICNAI